MRYANPIAKILILLALLVSAGLALWVAMAILPPLLAFSASHTALIGGAIVANVLFLLIVIFAGRKIQ